MRELVSHERIYLELVGARANVSEAARQLGMDPAELRTLVHRNPALMFAVLEVTEQALDQAETTLYQGLRSPDRMRRLEAARTILRFSPAACKRGFGPKARRMLKTKAGPS